jgi:hypothetical protein
MILNEFCLIARSLRRIVEIDNDLMNRAYFFLTIQENKMKSLVSCAIRVELQVLGMKHLKYQIF